VDDLLTWLRAQLDAVEKVAQAAARDAGGPEWSAGDENLSESVSLADAGSYVAAGPYGYLSWELRQHIADNDPAFVLTDVEAKRQIIEAHPAGRDHPEAADYCLECGPFWRDGKAHGYPCETLRLLALPFAGRPGWREEWRA